MPVPFAQVRHWTGLLAAPVLGVLFLIASATKAPDPVGFAAQIEAYGIFSGVWITRLLAWAIIAAEAVVGACLLLGLARRKALAAAGAMLVVFTAGTAWAWARGLEHSCGCFGSLLERTPGETLVEDFILLGLVGVAFFHRAPGTAAPARWRLVAVLALGAAGVLTPPAAARLAPLVAEGKTFSELGLDSFLPWEPMQYTLYAFLEPLQEGAQVRALDLLSRRGSTPVVGLSSADVEQIEAFRWRAGISFEIVNVSRTLLRRLSNDRPGAFLVVNGKVQKLWQGKLPQPGELPPALSSRGPGRPAETSVDKEVR
ncbi:MAG: MauE/DoxX family redox-associated membrane protein [Acidobacteriota bacterium]